MSVRRWIAVLGAAVVAVALPADPSYAVGPTDLYVATVDNGGSDANDCTTVDSACATIAHAINLAADSGTTIHVGAGTFDGRVQPGSKSVTIEGAATDSTVLTSSPDSPGYDATVVGITAGATTLSSLTVSGAQMAGVYLMNGASLDADQVLLTDAGCPLWVQDGSAEVTDSVIQNSGSGGCGVPPTKPGSGSVYLQSGSASLVRTQILNPAPDAPAVVVFGGVFNADQSYLDDTANEGDNNNSDGLDLKGGSATITRTTLHAFGTGVLVEGGAASVSDDTFQGNVVGLTSSSGSATVVRSTFEGELASLFQEVGGNISVAGSIMGVDDIQNCAGTITDLGYNLAIDATCAFSAPTSHENVDDLNLDAGLADWGGTVPTVAILNPSSAVDAIPAGATYGNDSVRLCPTSGSTDVRGVPRPMGGECDAGSMEMTGTRTTLEAPSTAHPGADVTLRATVGEPGVGVNGLEKPAGTVTFDSGGQVLCHDVRVTTLGQADCTTSVLPTGRSRIEATFSPSAGSTVHSSSAVTRITIGTKPSITAPGRVVLHVGRRARVRITAYGQPVPWLALTKGHLPPGLEFHHRRGHASITGTPAKRAAGTRHHLRVEAVNLLGHARHAITLVVRRR